SDLYTLGIVFYHMLAGRGPFAASDPLEWVHCHVARRPKPLGEVRPEIPPLVSDLIEKLLAKMSDARYQTASGLACDLERARDRWRTGGRVDQFPLGQDDVPDRLQIPEKLYGRNEPWNTLLAAFEEVARRGETVTALISGPPGIGKSALVHEFAS